MTDLETLRDRVEAFLTDASNLDWTTAELDNAIRLALSEVSTVLPVRAVATMDAVTEQWEYSLVAITGLVAVVEVWYPYLATSDSYKRAHPIKWRLISDNVLCLDIDDTPDGVYDLRVFYDKCQTLAGLDAETVTTLSDAEKSALVVGAASYAATGKSRDATNEVTLGRDVPQQLNRWGKSRWREFKERIADLGALQDAEEDARIGWWKSDKWDKAGD